jgi:serine/threonine protein phosphatase 1
MEDAAQWLSDRCQNYWRGEGFQCVHAGVRVSPGERNDAQTLIDDHGVVLRNRYDGPLTITGHIAIARPTWFAGDGRTAEALPLGEWRPLPDRGVICIDTGCGKGGKLTAMVIEDGDYTLFSSL